ncbi:MAG: hypothetical protein LUO96_03015 [Methanomicrobiales archaeon]|nr:hypothetical protein [Methanomicrobiales archaeon]
MRSVPALILLAFIISCMVIPGAAAADPADGSVAFTLEVVNPTPTPTGGGGGGGGGGGQTGRSSNDLPPYAPPPPALQPALQPGVPAEEAAGIPSSGNPPGAEPAGPSSPVSQPGTSPSGTAPSLVPAYSSILFTFLLFAVATTYVYLRRDVLALYQTWITLYLISMTGLLWAAFVTSQGAPLSETVFLVTCVVGLNLIVHLLRFDRVRIALPVPGGPGR